LDSTGKQIRHQSIQFHSSHGGLDEQNFTTATNPIGFPNPRISKAMGSLRSNLSFLDNLGKATLLS
jgi:hypothetical protein